MQKILIGREYPKNVIDLINESKNKIDIVIYDWRWYFDEIGSTIQQFNQALLRATDRGVKVRAVVNNDFVSPFLKDSKIEVKKLDSKKTLHIKLVLFDEKVAVIGSHNFTKNAFEINHEISVIIDDEENVKRCQEFFNNLNF